MIEFPSFTRPHRLAAQDVALSRPKRGFEFLWGHKAKRGSPLWGCYSNSSGGTKQNEDPHGGDAIRIPLGAQSKTRIPMAGMLFEFLWGHKAKRGSPLWGCYSNSSGGTKQNEDPHGGDAIRIPLGAQSKTRIPIAGMPFKFLLLPPSSG